MKARALIAVGLTLAFGTAMGPAEAEAPSVPANPNVVDVAGDANYLVMGDSALPVQPFPEVDLLDGWFTTTGTWVTAHVRVAGDPRESTVATNLQMWANGPEEGWVRDGTGTTCLVWAALFPGASDSFAPVAVTRDGCVMEAAIRGRLNVREASDGTFVVSVSAPRAMTQALRSGRTLKNPYMVSRQRIGNSVQSVWPTVDATETGINYRVP